MPRLTWSPQWEIGIATIDAQHRHLVHLVHTLQYHIERGELTQAEEAMRTLVEEKIRHFAYEENLLRRMRFSFLKPHQREHRAFLETCTGFLKRAEAGEYVLPEALRFVERWLVKHLQGEDLDYAAYARQHQALAMEADDTPWHLRTLSRFFPTSRH